MLAHAKGVRMVLMLQFQVAGAEIGAQRVLAGSRPLEVRGRSLRSPLADARGDRRDDDFIFYIVS